MDLTLSDWPTEHLASEIDIVGPASTVASNTTAFDMKRNNIPMYEELNNEQSTLSPPQKGICFEIGS